MKSGKQLFKTECVTHRSLGRSYKRMGTKCFYYEIGINIPNGVIVNITQ